MMQQNYRFTLYIIGAILFGITNWYLPSWVGNIPIGNTPNFSYAFLSQIVISSIWLIPVFFIAIHEINVSKKLKTPPLATMTFWVTAVLVYYLCYTTHILAGRGNQLEYLQIGESNWIENNILFFNHAILPNLAKWGLVACIGGLVIGLLVGRLTLCFRKVACK